MKKKTLVSIIAVVVVAAVAIVGGSYAYTAHAKDVKEHQIEAKQEAQKKAAEEAQAQAMTDFEKNQGHWSKNQALGYINPYESWFKPQEIAPGKNLLKSAESYAVPANQVAQMIAGDYKGNQKEVFLTFDDGPSTDNTPKILNILKNEGVHATFFVIGDHLKSNPAIQQIVRQEIMDGNAVGDHTFTHVYSQLYPNNSIDVPYFMNQVEETQTLLTDVLGPNFDTRIVRLPGGYMSRAYYHDPNLIKFNEALDKANDTALDWTAETGDSGTTAVLNVNQLISIMDSDIKAQSNPNQVILLMHDAGAKKDTVTALPSVIQYFKDHGYQFKVIENAPASSFVGIPAKTDTYSNQGESLKKETVTVDGKQETKEVSDYTGKGYQYN
ncbi:MAG: polysaccharide deacetylase family protein [Clostridium sp.]|uniref:polysaccharide deacetylase family protein n=1 Tax=Clostridium sp. TaxID=1506 RepID=UPI003EE65C22